MGREWDVRHVVVPNWIMQDKLVISVRSVVKNESPRLVHIFDLPFSPIVANASIGVDDQSW